MKTTDGRRARGALSRQTVMRLAVDIASVEGLEGLSLSTLATGSSLSKRVQHHPCGNTRGRQQAKTRLS